MEKKEGIGTSSEPLIPLLGLLGLYRGQKRSSTGPSSLFLSCTCKPGVFLSPTPYDPLYFMRFKRLLEDLPVVFYSLHPGPLA